jgi:hypothetical protein
MRVESRTVECCKVGVTDADTCFGNVDTLGGGDGSGGSGGLRGLGGSSAS